jgi:hypothetical protein
MIYNYKEDKMFSLVSTILNHMFGKVFLPPLYRIKKNVLFAMKKERKNY